MSKNSGVTMKVQMISNPYGNGQFFITIPASLARAIDIEKGELVEWTLVDRHTLQLHRPGVKKIEDEMQRREGREKQRREDLATGKNWLETPRDE